MVRPYWMGGCFSGKEMTEYIERKNTHKRMMNVQLKFTIKSLDEMAANALNPDKYRQFKGLMEDIKKIYK